MSIDVGAVNVDLEAVIGLEVHCELATATKMFCACPNTFGAEPNTNVCPVCLGLPGSLPVLNARAVEFALRFGVALDFTIPERSSFARKNYFYPDMPKDYQISQYDEPICIDGSLEVDETRVGIERAHLEEDTGKTLHIGGGGRIHDATHSLIDYNRAGVPLMEIVSRPDIRSAGQARTYVQELRAVLLALEISDVKMEEGSLRVDANVSVRARGDRDLGTKVEIKNMNSLRSLGRAIDYEIERQTALVEAGESVAQETRHWNEAEGRTSGMRSKEEAFDYRYFAEPDLVPVAPTEEMRAAAAAAVPELPAARRVRLVDEWSITEHDARVLVATDGLAEYAQAAVSALQGGSPKDVVNWCTGDLLAYLHDAEIDPSELPFAPDALAELVDLVAGGSISRTQAKQVLEQCLRSDKELRPRDVVAEQGIEQMSDEAALAGVLDEILAAHPDEVAAYRDGDDKARKRKRKFFMSEAMKATRGRGNPQLLNRLLDEILG